MRQALIALSVFLCSLNPAFAQLSINFGTPGLSIGINLPVYPRLQRIPGYPVYYAPGVSSNYFFYDGLYWVFQEDNWYASSWYNGPWGLVDPQDVPLYVLRVPVRYYRHAPSYFYGWRAEDPPRWGEHWGPSWEQRHGGWDRWDRRSAPAPAPLPTYQRQYSGSRYPQASQQAALESRNYRYQPREPLAQQHFQQLRTQAASAPPPQRQQQQQQQQQQRQQPQPRQQQPAQRPEGARQQQAPIAREQQAPRQPLPQRVERKPQQAPVAHEQPTPRQPAPQQVERKPQQAPAARGQQAPRPQAQEKAPPGRAKEQRGEKDNKDNKDNKDR